MGDFLPANLRFLRYDHILQMFLVASVILISILVAGCTSTALSDVYLLSLSYTDQSETSHNDSLQTNQNISTTIFNIVSQGGVNASTSVKVRVGFLGFCLEDSSRTWICVRSATSLANFIRGSRSSSVDPLNIVWIAKESQEQSLFSGLWFASIAFIFACFILLATFPGWHEEEGSNGHEREVRSFPSRVVTEWAIAAGALASLLSFVSAFWQHITCATGAAMVRSLSYGMVKTVIGTPAMILAWASVLLVIAPTLGILILYWSIKVLAETFG